MLDTSKDHPRFRATYAALELLSAIESRASPPHVLDVGGGSGIHCSFFRSQGLQVDLVDIAPGVPERKHVGDFLSFAPGRRYEVVWASHVLEHVPNAGAFIRHLIHCAAEGGWLCITVPPAKPEMTFGHVSQWSAGLLLINLIKAGLDCREARVLTRGYNVSVLTSVKFRADDEYGNWLPSNIEVKDGYFDGDIDELNWSIKEIPGSLRLPGDFRSMSRESALRELKKGRNSGFLLCQGENDGAVRFHYYASDLQELVIVS